MSGLSLRPRMAGFVSASVVMLVVAAPASALAQSLLGDVALHGEGYSDVELPDHFWVEEDHWIRLTGTGLLQTPCGDRELEFSFDVSGREHFVLDSYRYAVDLPVGQFILTDPAEGDLVIMEATLSTTLSFTYPRPSGAPYWRLDGDWESSSSRELRDGCEWSELQTQTSAGPFSLEPSSGESDEMGVRICASGVLVDVVALPVSISETGSFGKIKALFRP